MIIGNTNVVIADTNQDDVYRGSINKVIQNFSSKIVRMNQEDNYQLTLKNSIFIRDHFGWTKLNSIMKSKYSKWVKIISNLDGPTLIVSDNSYIPVYDTNDTKIAFHGEVQYHYKLKPVLELTKNDIIRVRNPFISETENITEFINIEGIETYEELIDSYTLMTNSGFYTANKIQIWCDDNYISKDKNKKLYK